jgi:hypothetical protein
MGHPSVVVLRMCGPPVLVKDQRREKISSESALAFALYSPYAGAGKRTPKMEHQVMTGQGINEDDRDGEASGCLECMQLKETFQKTARELGMHHDELDSCVKDIAYIHKEAELYEANNNARRAFNDHREKVHETMAFA